MKKLFIIFCIFLSTSISAMDQSALSWTAIAEIASKIKILSDQYNNKFLEIANKLGITSQILNQVSQTSNTSLMVSSAALCIGGYSIWRLNQQGRKIDYQENKIAELSAQLSSAYNKLSETIAALSASQHAQEEASAGRHNELRSLYNTEAIANTIRHAELLKHQEKGFTHVAAALVQNDSEWKKILSELSEHEQQCFAQFQLALDHNKHQIHQLQKKQSEEVTKLGSKIKEGQQKAHTQLNKIKSFLDSLQSELSHEFIEIDHKLEEFSKSIQIFRKVDVKIAADRHAELNQWLQDQQAHLWQSKKSLEQVIQLQAEDKGIQIKNNQKLKKQQNEINGTLIMIEDSLKKFRSELGKTFVGLNENQIKMVDAMKIFAETFESSNAQAIDANNQLLSLIQ